MDHIASSGMESFKYLMSFPLVFVAAAGLDLGTPGSDTGSSVGSDAVAGAAVGTSVVDNDSGAVQQTGEVERN